MNKAKIVPGIALVISAAFLGLISGVLFVKFFVPGSGWDALANVLGGVLFGVLGGLAVGAALVAYLRVEILRRVAWTGGALALAILVASYAYNRLSEEPPAEQGPRETAPKPTVPVPS